MVNLEEYKKSEDKVKYFHSLSNGDKLLLWESLHFEKDEPIKLWNSFDERGKKSLLSLLSVGHIQELMSSFNKKEKKDALNFFDKNKLRGFLKILPEAERKEYNDLLAEKEPLSISTIKEKLVDKKSNEDEKKDYVDEIINSKEEVLDEKVVESKTSDSVSKKNTGVTKESVTENVKNVQSLSQTGVQFNYPSVAPNTTVDVGKYVDKDVVANMSNEQIVEMQTILQSYVEKQKQKEMQAEHDKTQETGRARVYSNGNVSLGFLAAIIIFLLAVMFLFF